MRRTTRLLLALAVPAGFSAGVLIPQFLQPPMASCGATGRGALAPSADLYCMELTPRPEVAEAEGTAELGRAASPFDVALTVEGSQRYAVTLDLRGLPPPQSLGAYTTYVAWVAAPSLDPVRKLGVVRNGRTVLGEV
ncbi:MAG: hypothetical protein JNJ98_14795, partial [Gemmatimonadetes bacterium]|nr:hypothetical protein [Gemmatimonadota bacterium]